MQKVKQEITQKAQALEELKKLWLKYQLARVVDEEFFTNSRELTRERTRALAMYQGYREAMIDLDSIDHTEINSIENMELKLIKG